MGTPIAAPELPFLHLLKQEEDAAQRGGNICRGGVPAQMLRPPCAAAPSGRSSPELPQTSARAGTVAGDGGRQVPGEQGRDEARDGGRNGARVGRALCNGAPVLRNGLCTCSESTQLPNLHRCSNRTREQRFG